jgi:hypothetical protein
VDLHRALGQGRRTLDGLDLIDIRIDERLVCEVDAAEFKTMSFWRGLEGERDFLPGVEGSSFESGLTCEGVLDGGGHGGAGFIFSQKVSSRNGALSFWYSGRNGMDGRSGNYRSHDSHFLDAPWSYGNAIEVTGSPWNAVDGEGEFLASTELRCIEIDPRGAAEIARGLELIAVSCITVNF